MEKEVIIHKCVICGADVNCYDSSRKKGERKKYCVDPFTGKSCLLICPVPTHPRGGSFCEEHKKEILKNDKDWTEDEPW